MFFFYGMHIKYCIYLIKFVTSQTGAKEGSFHQYDPPPLPRLPEAEIEDRNKKVKMTNKLISHICSLFLSKFLVIIKEHWVCRGRRGLLIVQGGGDEEGLRSVHGGLRGGGVECLLQGTLVVCLTRRWK